MEQRRQRQYVQYREKVEIWQIVIGVRCPRGGFGAGQEERSGRRPRAELCSRNGAFLLPGAGPLGPTNPSGRRDLVFPIALLVKIRTSNRNTDDLTKWLLKTDRNNYVTYTHAIKKLSVTPVKNKNNFSTDTFYPPF